MRAYNINNERRQKEGEKEVYKIMTRQDLKKFVNDKLKLNNVDVDRFIDENRINLEDVACAFGAVGEMAIELIASETKDYDLSKYAI
jgi:hypothetical protein